jgi:hypothetical protein
MTESAGSFWTHESAAKESRRPTRVNDREQASAQHSREFGIESCISFEPSFAARTSAAKQGPAKLRCAFFTGASDIH